MKAYEERIKEAYEYIQKEYPALINMARESEEGRRVLLNVLHREANVDKSIMIKWINANTELHYELRHK